MSDEPRWRLQRGQCDRPNHRPHTELLVLGATSSGHGLLHNCFDALMTDVVKRSGNESIRVFTTLDTEMTLSTLWDHEGLEVMCSKDELWREAGEMERKTV